MPGCPRAMLLDMHSFLLGKACSKSSGQCRDFLSVDRNTRPNKSLCESFAHHFPSVFTDFCSIFWQVLWFTLPVLTFVGWWASDCL